MLNKGIGIINAVCFTPVIAEEGQEMFLIAVVAVLSARGIICERIFGNAQIMAGLAGCVAFNRETAVTVMRTVIESNQSVRISGAQGSCLFCGISGGKI